MGKFRGSLQRIGGPKVFLAAGSPRVEEVSAALRNLRTLREELCSAWSEEKKRKGWALGALGPKWPQSPVTAPSRCWGISQPRTQPPPLPHTGDAGQRPDGVGGACGPALGLRTPDPAGSRTRKSWLPTPPQPRRLAPQPAVPYLLQPVHPRASPSGCRRRRGEGPCSARPFPPGSDPGLHAPVRVSCRLCPSTPTSLIPATRSSRPLPPSHCPASADKAPDTPTARSPPPDPDPPALLNPGPQPRTSASRPGPR